MTDTTPFSKLRKINIICSTWVNILAVNDYLFPPPGLSSTIFLPQPIFSASNTNFTHLLNLNREKEQVRLEVGFDINNPWLEKILNIAPLKYIEMLQNRPIM